VKSSELKALLAVIAMGALFVAVPVFIATLGASLEVEHGAPGSRIENLRWVDDDGEHGSARSLLPGESTSLDLGYFDTGTPRRLRFDLVVDGSRVVLTSRRVFVLKPRDEQHVVIDAAFAVTHPMSEPPSAPSGTAASAKP